MHAQSLRRRFAALALLALIVIAESSTASAAVTHWEVLKREPYAGSKPLGDRGAYERWTGKIHFAIDPKTDANRVIVDLALVPPSADGVNEDGFVEFSTDFEMLVPVDRTKANGAVFYEVNNRGNRTAPNIIDGGADEFLCRQGFVVLSSGWIAEVQPDSGRLRLQAPVPLDPVKPEPKLPAPVSLDPDTEKKYKPLRGIVRNELVVDRATPKASISHRGNQGSFRPASDRLAQATLTRRERQADARESVPADQWKLIVTDVESDGVKGQLPLVELEVRGGLQPGWIYEILYEAEGSLVVGAGLAGIRDAIASLKHADAPALNPLLSKDNKPLITRAIGFGTSQSGRCLRHFLWEGFNADEAGRKVFDGVISHVAGGGLGSFNHRFASPTRTNGQHEEHEFPADFFPFAYGDEQDPHSDATDGILARCRKSDTLPKLFHTQSTSEYWHRSGSLVHTDPLGKRDSDIPSNVRLYTFGGTQHGPGSGVPGARSTGQLPSNPADYRPFMRALVVALDAWIKDGREPPSSVYPRISDGTLVDWRREKSGWPAVPGVEYPKVIQRPIALFRGPDWRTKRIASVEPPQIEISDPPERAPRFYNVLVPAVDKTGNTLGTLNLPAIRVPVATYTSWNLRDKSIGAAGELLALQGGYIPLPRTKADREANKDPRPALEDLYKNYTDYEQQYLAAAKKLIEDRYVLAEDLPRLAALCKKSEPHFTPVPSSLTPDP